jgi:hypothetical protein
MFDKEQVQSNRYAVFLGGILYKLEDSKRILCRNSKDSQYNGQKENEKKTNSGQQLFSERTSSI